MTILFNSCNNTPKEYKDSNRSNNKYYQKTEGTKINKDKTAALKKNVNYTVNIVQKYNHDPYAFTQGLVYYNGYLYESTGLKGSSSLRKVEIETGKVLKEIDVSPDYFAEGITILSNKIYQLTWNSNLCLVYDLQTFKQLKTFDYYGEGWGLTNNGEQIIMSDGSNIIRFINPANFKVIRTISVTDDNYNPVHNLNELEYIKGELWANIWQSDRIARIEPESGHVNSWIDISELRKYLQDNPDAEVSNGIAYDSLHDRLFLTGKNWPFLFEVRVIEKQ